MRFCNRASYLLLITVIFILLSGCKSTKPSFPFHTPISETTFYAQISDSGFTAPELINKGFSCEQKTVGLSRKKVSSFLPNLSINLPSPSNGTKNFYPSIVASKGSKLKSKSNFSDFKQNQLPQVLAGKTQNKVPIPLLIAVGFFTIVNLGLYFTIRNILTSYKNIAAVIVFLLLILSLIIWIILVIKLLILLILLIPPVYLALFLGVFVLALFIWRGIKYYKKPKANE